MSGGEIDANCARRNSVSVLSSSRMRCSTQCCVAGAGSILWRPQDRLQSPRFARPRNDGKRRRAAMPPAHSRASGNRERCPRSPSIRSQQGNGHAGCRMSRASLSRAGVAAAMIRARSADWAGAGYSAAFTGAIPGPASASAIRLASRRATSSLPSSGQLSSPFAVMMVTAFASPPIAQ